MQRYKTGHDTNFVSKFSSETRHPHCVEYQLKDYICIYNYIYIYICVCVCVCVCNAVRHNFVFY
jgi:hypothetical protein